MTETTERWPITLEELTDLGKYVDTHVHIVGDDLIVGCDNTLRHTLDWLNDHSESDHPLEETLTWIREQGGYCDCEVMLNVVSRLVA